MAYAISTRWVFGKAVRTVMAAAAGSAMLGIMACATPGAPERPAATATTQPAPASASLNSGPAPAAAHADPTPPRTQAAASKSQTASPAPAQPVSRAVVDQPAQASHQPAPAVAAPTAVPEVVAATATDLPQQSSNAPVARLFEEEDEEDAEMASDDAGLVLEDEDDASGSSDEFVSERYITINGAQLNNEIIAVLEWTYGPIADGDYWYDPVSGAVGRIGGPTSGFIHPNLALGGRLSADASWGDTGVFVNGRELHQVDLASLQNILRTYILPGRYWIDAQGYYGYEGGPVLGNLHMAYTGQGGGNPGGGQSYIRESYGGWIGSDGQTSYYFDPQTGCSVIPGEGVSC